MTTDESCAYCFPLQVLKVREEPKRDSAETEVGAIALDHEEIMEKKGSPHLDTTRDYQYTNWKRVQSFGEKFLATLALSEGPRLVVGRAVNLR